MLENAPNTKSVCRGVLKQRAPWNAHLQEWNIVNVVPVV